MNTYYYAIKENEVMQFKIAVLVKETHALFIYSLLWFIWYKFPLLLVFKIYLMYCVFCNNEKQLNTNNVKQCQIISGNDCGLLE